MRFRFILPKVLVLTSLTLLLSGCGTRTRRAPVAVTSTEVSLEEQKARELTAIWGSDLTAYLQRDEGDWPTRLSQLRDIQTRRGLRPGRIRFSTLAAGGDPDRADAWDVCGLLLGKQTLEGRLWYLFIVGVVWREDFRPVEIRDVRMMAFATGGSDPLWSAGDANAESLARYKETYKENIPIRFPADDDGYELELEGNQVTVRELRSGAQWTLWVSEAEDLVAMPR